MNGVEEVFFSCPYCGEPISVLVEPEALDEHGGLAYIEDCQVCCRPMLLAPRLAADGSIEIDARHENE